LFVTYLSSLTLAKAYRADVGVGMDRVFDMKLQCSGTSPMNRYILLSGFPISLILRNLLLLTNLNGMENFRGGLKKLHVELCRSIQPSLMHLLFLPSVEERRRYVRW
jgi:hypothetical protein